MYNPQVIIHLPLGNMFLKIISIGTTSESAFFHG